MSLNYRYFQFFDFINYSLNVCSALNISVILNGSIKLPHNRSLRAGQTLLLCSNFCKIQCCSKAKSLFLEIDDIFMII